MSYTRRAEMTWTPVELTQHGNKILLKNEALYIVQTDGTRTVRFGDGVTVAKNLPVSIDYGAVKTQADRAQTQATAAQTSAGEAAVSAEQAAQAANYWTPSESVKQLAHHETHEGQTLDIKGTLAGPAEIEIFGDTVLTPTDIDQPVSPDNPQAISCVGGTVDWNGLLEQGGIDTSGNLVSMQNRVRDANFAVVQPNYTYRISADGAERCAILEYDETKKFIKASWDIATASSMLDFDYTMSGTTKYIKLSLCKLNINTNLTPAAINNVNICPVFNLLRSSKNLFKTSNATNYGLSITVGDDGELTLSGTATKTYVEIKSLLNLPVNQMYHYSITATTGDGRLLLTNNGAQSRYIDNNSSFVLAHNEEVARVVLNGLTVGTTYNNIKIKIQLELGNKGTDYAPCMATTYTIPLKDESGTTLDPLACIWDNGNVVARDRIFRDVDGKWKVERKTGRITVTSSTRIDDVDYFQTPNTYTPVLKTISVNSIAGFDQHITYLMADKLPAVNYYNFRYQKQDGVRQIIAAAGGKDITARLLKSDVDSCTGTTTLDKVNTYLAANPITVCYTLATPKTTTLHADAQTALNQLSEMLPDRTIIMSLDAVQPTLKTTVGLQPKAAVYTKPESDAKYSNALIRKASGEIVDMYTAQAPAKRLEILGESVQDSTSGKNLLPQGANTSTSSGITFTKNADGSVKISGTSTSIAYYNMPKPTLNPGSYYLSGGNTGARVIINTSKTSYIAAPRTFTIVEGETVNSIFIEIASGKTVNETIYPQIELGTTSTAYEPYTGGMPSPNPEFPQEIKSVGDGGLINVIKSNGNLLANGRTSTDITLYRTVANKDGSFTTTTTIATGTGSKGVLFLNAPKYLKPDTLYTIIVDMIKNVTSKKFEITAPSSQSPWDYNGYAGVSSTGRSRYVLKTKKELAPNMYVLFGGFTYFEAEVDSTYKLAIFEGDVDINTPFDYQTDISEPIPIPLKGADGKTLEPLRSLPYDSNRLFKRDRVFKDRDGGWKIERNITKLDASMAWYKTKFDYNFEPAGYAVFGLNNVKTGSQPETFNASCNLLPIKGVVTQGTGIDRSSVVTVGRGTWACISVCMRHEDIGVSASDANDVKLSKFKAWATEKKLEIHVAAMSPTYQPLHPDTCRILDDLSQMYDGRTVIMGTDAISPSFEVEYVQDINYTMDQLSSAIIALGGTI